MDRRKTDEADAEQIAELVRAGMVTRTQLLPPKYLALRRCYGEFCRLRYERARLKTLATCLGAARQCARLGAFRRER